MAELPMLCPIKPHELDKQMRTGLQSIVERVAGAAIIHSLGRDLLLLVYMAGFSHGAKAMELTRDRDRDRGADETRSGSVERSEIEPGAGTAIAQDPSHPTRGQYP